MRPSTPRSWRMKTAHASSTARTQGPNALIFGELHADLGDAANGAKGIATRKKGRY